MLRCAADIGDNGRCLGFVIGPEIDINATRKAIPHKSIHMRKIRRNKTQHNIVKILAPKGNVRLFCFRINRPQIINKFKKLGKNRTIKKDLNKSFNYILVKEIRDIIEPYLHMYRTSINDLSIEVDDDMRKTFITTGLKTTEPNTAHELADIVAWTNTNRCLHNKNIKEFNIVNKIESQLKRECK